MPVRIHFIEPVPNRRERIEIDLVDTHAPVVLDAILDDEPGFAQHAKMTAERRRAHVHTRSELTGTQGLAQKLSDHRAARGVRQG